VYLHFHLRLRGGIEFVANAGRARHTE